MTRPEFIFMLTKDDVTVSDAIQRVQDVKHPGIRILGFKDIGLGFRELENLTSAIQSSGRQVALEVVSLSQESELHSAEMAVSLGVDCLLGGTRGAQVCEIIAGTPIRYYPFPGHIVGHPSRLRGTREEIIESARLLAATRGVTGLDLLAYRYDGDAENLMKLVVDAVDVPVIVAGSIDSPERIRAVVDAGAWGFTVGSAAFAGLFAPEQTNLEAQLREILRTRDSHAHSPEIPST